MKLSKVVLKENEKRSRNIIVSLFRYLGFNLALKLKGTKITPNQITIVSFIFGLLAAFSFIKGAYFYFILGALLYQISVIFDYCDGSLARLKDMNSFSGMWLDLNNDNLEEFLVIFSICWGLYAQMVDIRIWILGFILCGTSFMSDILLMTFKSFPFAKQEISSLVSKSKLHMIGRHFIHSRALRNLTIIFFALLNQMFIFLVFFSCYEALLLLVRMVSLGKTINRHNRLKLSSI